jgi:hypothetical protein
VPTWLASGLEVLSGDGYWKFEKLWQALMYGLIGSFPFAVHPSSYYFVIELLLTWNRHIDYRLWGLRG